jgi:hypothetical protein
MPLFKKTPWSPQPPPPGIDAAAEIWRVRFTNEVLAAC